MAADPYARIRQWQTEIDHRQNALDNARRMWRIMILRAHLSGLSLAQIGEQIGYTRSRVQQLIVQARADIEELKNL